jgi:hypothetical protein
MARILITGGRAPAALDLARKFDAAGHTVFAADSAPWMLCGASRAVHDSFRLPEPKHHPYDFALQLARVIERERIDVVVPTCEEVFYVGRFKTLLSERARVFCPDIDILRSLHSKWEFTRLVEREAGFGGIVHAPESWRITGGADISTLPAPSDQLVFKPVFSRFAVETLIRPAAETLRAIGPSAERPWLAQRCIEGRELCSYSVCLDGAVQAHALYEPTWRAGKGAGIFFEPRAVPAIARFVEGLARHFNLTGQVAFDFIEDYAGRIFVLECNPRATSGVHLFDADLAGAFLAPGTTAQPQPRPRMVAPAMMLFGGMSVLRSRHLAYDWQRLWRDFRRSRDVLWSAADPWPALYSLLGAAAFSWRGLRHGVSATAATTLDIEWDGGVIA